MSANDAARANARHVEEWLVDEADQRERVDPEFRIRMLEPAIAELLEFGFSYDEIAKIYRIETRENEGRYHDAVKAVERELADAL